MLADTPVYKVMTRKPASIAPSDNMDQIRHFFEEKGFHHAPVVDNGKLVGIVSYTDYIRVIRDVFSNNAHVQADNEKMLSAVLVKDVMATEVFTVEEHETLDKVVEAFKMHAFHAIPVVDQGGHLTGIVTTNDLLKVMEHLFLQGR